MRTKEQQAAIETTGVDLLVSAAAGSGKTTVLIDRIMRMIREEKTDVTDLLVVTFTRDAANVMRQRLQKALENAAAESEGDEAAFFARQIDLLPAANISTMHTFCQKILRRHFALAGVPADFRVGDEQKMQTLRRNAVRELLEEEYRTGMTEFSLLSERYGRTSGDDALIELLLSVYDFSRNQEDPARFLRDAVHLFDTWTAGDLSHPWNAALLREIARTLKRTQEMLDRAEEMASLREETDDYPAVLGRDREIVTARLAALAVSYDAYCAAMADGFGRAPSRRGLTDGEKAYREQVKKRRDAAKKAMKDADDAMASLAGEETEEEMAQTRVLVREVVRLVQLLDASLDERMKEERILDFSALEHGAIAALQNGAAESVKKECRAIFFDEYQDANRVQEKIVQLLAGEDNLFFVGDVKQSIYRFRSAEPALFLEKYTRWGAGEGGRRIDLNRNFRSVESILAAVNSVFERIMTADAGAVVYDRESRLYPGMESQSGGVPAELHILPSQDDAELDALSALRTDEAEARYTAHLVRDVLENGRVRDENGELRPVKKGDIAILLRTAQPGAESIAYALEREGIDCVAQMSSRHFDTVEVRALLSALSVLDNPYQDVPLLGVLRSPLFLFSLDDLARVRLADRNAPFIDAMRACARESGPTALRCRAAVETLDRWRLLSHVLSVEALLERIMADTDYEQMLAASPIGGQKLANIRLLLSRVAEFENDAMGGVSEFLSFVRDVRRGTDREEAILSRDGEDVVRIMTIHRSKGLEFPVVILPMLGRKFHRDDRRDLAMESGHGIALKGRDSAGDPQKNVAFRAVSAVNAGLDREEEMRVLYVAMTRARDRLILCGMSDVHWRGEEPASQENALLDWVVPCAQENPDVWKVVRAEPSIVWRETEPQEKEKQASDAEDTQIDPDLLEKLDTIFSWQYPYPADTQRLSKTTVTALKLYENEPEMAMEAALPLIRAPRRYDSSYGMRRGTATHLAAQHLSFSACHSQKDVTAQTDRLAEEKYLTWEDRRLIDDGDLWKLCQSELGARLRRAEENGSLHRETPFTLATGGTMVQGAMDAWFEEDGALVLVDYKTDTVNEEGAKGLLRHYARQLQWYARALTALSGLPVREAILWSFSAKEAAGTSPEALEALLTE